jgi:hypothetical protein
VGFRTPSAVEREFIQSPRNTNGGSVLRFCEQFVTRTSVILSDRSIGVRTARQAQQEPPHTQLGSSARTLGLLSDIDTSANRGIARKMIFMAVTGQELSRCACEDGWVDCPGRESTHGEYLRRPGNLGAEAPRVAPNQVPSIEVGFSDSAHVASCALEPAGSAAEVEVVIRKR